MMNHDDTNDGATSAAESLNGAGPVVAESPPVSTAKPAKKKRKAAKKKPAKRAEPAVKAKAQKSAKKKSAPAKKGGKKSNRGPKGWAPSKRVRHGKPEDFKFGKLIAKTRSEKGLSQKMLAAKCEMVQPAIANIEVGTVKAGLGAAKKICKVLHLSFEKSPAAIREVMKVKAREKRLAVREAEKEARAAERVKARDARRALKAQAKAAKQARKAEKKSASKKPARAKKGAK